MGHTSTQAPGASPRWDLKPETSPRTLAGGKHRGAWHGGGSQGSVALAAGVRGGLQEGTGGSWPCYAVCSPHRGTASCGFAGGCRRGFQLLPAQPGLGEDSTARTGLGAIRDKGMLARTHS